MKKEILKLGKALTKAEQKTILGGLIDIRMGFCIVNGRQIPVACDRTCPNGSAPFCMTWD